MYSSRYLRGTLFRAFAIAAIMIFVSSVSPAFATKVSVDYHGDTGLPAGIDYTQVTLGYNAAGDLKAPDGTVIHNLGKGVLDKDAVNVLQLKDMKQEILNEVGPGAGAWKLSVGGDTATDVAAGSTVTLTAGENIDVTRGTDNEAIIALKPDISLNSVTTSGEIKVGGALDVTGATTLNDTLDVTGATTLNDTLNVKGATTLEDTLNVKGMATFMSGADMNNKKIINLAPGEVSPTSTDAVNGSQLWDAIDRTEKVGAHAAALAGLHPLSYDPNAPTGFAFALGNYAGKTSVAVGLNHYLSRDVLLSISSTLGSGNNMVSVGASMRLGRKTKVEEGAVFSNADVLARLEKLEAENESLKKQLEEMSK